jgi:peptide/nickel transport system permease protein
VRLLGTVILLFVLSVLVFLLTYLAPGDLVKTLLGVKDVTPQAIAAVRAEYHLDQPLWMQYAVWIGGVLHGDLGQSIRYQSPVSVVLGSRVAVTLTLSALSFAIAVIVSVPLGIVSAVRAESALDRIIGSVSIVGISAPAFAVSLILLHVFALDLRWFPIYGIGDGHGWQLIYHLLLPALTLAIGLGAILVKLTRTAVARELDQDYVTFARARGLTQSRTLALVLRNAAAPIVTGLGLMLSYLVSGTVLVETVFALPGLGLLLQDAVLYKDIPVVQSLTLLIAAVIAIVALLVDLAYLALDPRVRDRIRPA